MTLTKARITEIIAAENGWSQKQSSEYIDLLIKTLNERKSRVPQLQGVQG